MASIAETIPAHQHHQPKLSFTRHPSSTPLAVLPQAPVAPPATSPAKLAAATAAAAPLTKASKHSTPEGPRIMSFSVASNGGFVPTNGMHAAQRPAADAATYQPRPVSSIYTAQYSGVAVYEMEVNGISVMRRRSDAWLNATQILKVAGVDKGKRTKVLEKEILSGEHEKVQGGYGKYQGTWISFIRGRDFCRAYGVEELLRPLLEYDMGADGQIGAGTVETPTKEQALAAARKKMMMNGGMDHRPGPTPNGTFFKNISMSAANAIQALNKARFDDGSARAGNGPKRPSNVRTSSQNLGGSQESPFPGSSQQSMQSMHSEGNYGMHGQLDPFVSSRTPSFYAKHHRPSSGPDLEPPRKRVKQSSQGHYSSFLANGVTDAMEETPTEANESFVYHQMPFIDQDPTIAGVRPMPQSSSAAYKDNSERLMSLFMDPNQQDMADAGFDTLTGEELDTPIDSTAHTALHWSATLARPALIRMLVSRGASIFRVNHGGETALMRAVQSTNNYEQNSFTELLELLGPSIETRDDRGRTVLHHIAISSSIKGKSAACRYYLESLLEFVVRNGSSQDSQGTTNGDSQAKARSIGLARFMSEIVNAQDMAGDTALNIAARNDSKGIVRQLIEVGANPSIANSGGFKPHDFGVVASEAPAPALDFLKSPESPAALTSSQQTVTATRVADSSRDLVSSLSTLIADTETSFRSEMQAKQSLIDQAQAQLRDATVAMKAGKQELAQLAEGRLARQMQDLRVTNLRNTNDVNRTQLATTGPPARHDVTLGDADTGLTFELSAPHLPHSIEELTPEQERYLDSLPAAAVLEARDRAYHAHNCALDEKRKTLQGKSFALEKKLRRLIALSTGTDETHVDAMLGPLRDAVESEGGEEVDYLRLREFLRKIT